MVPANKASFPVPFSKDIFRQRIFAVFDLTEKVSFFTAAFMVPANKASYILTTIFNT